MAKVDIWMPVYIGDYLRDTEELNAEEHGAYLLLLMHYWLKGGVIGSDVARLSRVARTSEETARFILGYYFTLEDGNYKNKRADEEMGNAQKRRDAARENGRSGGRPRKNNPQITGGFSVGIPDDNRAGNPQKSSSSSSSSSSSPIPIQEEEKNNIICPDSDSDKPKRFTKPTLEEVQAYCLERHNSVNPEKFIDYYESCGWKVGNKPMKNWQAAVRTWEKNNFDSGNLKVNDRATFLDLEE